MWITDTWRGRQFLLWYDYFISFHSRIALDCWLYKLCIWCLKPHLTTCWRWWLQLGLETFLRWWVWFCLTFLRFCSYYDKSVSSEILFKFIFHKVILWGMFVGNIIAKASNCSSNCTTSIRNLTGLEDRFGHFLEIKETKSSIHIPKCDFEDILEQLIQVRYHVLVNLLL